MNFPFYFPCFILRWSLNPAENPTFFISFPFTFGVGAWGGVGFKTLATIRTVPGSIYGGVTAFYSDILLPTAP